MKRIISIIAIIMMTTSCAQTEIDGLKVRTEKRVEIEEPWKLFIPKHDRLVREVTITRSISNEVYTFDASPCMRQALMIFFNHPLADSLNFRALRNFKGILHNELIHKYKDFGTNPMGITIRYANDSKPSFIMINPDISDSFPLAKMGILFHEMFHLMGEFNGHCDDCLFILREYVNPELISREFNREAVNEFFLLLIERQKQLGDRIHQQ